MSSPTRLTAHKKVIKEFVRGVENIEAKLESDVSVLCSRLLFLGNNFALVASNQRSRLQELLLGRYNAIYWSLKLHIAFHIGPERALEHEELRNLGSFIQLTPELLENLPGEEHAVDPGSEVLEILSVIVEFTGVKRGSHDHAERVLKRAKDLFSSLRKNRFRPKVLAMVSWNDSWFVGSSVAVSPFLRPHCLHNRIIKFKVRLQEALVFRRALCLPDDQANGWCSSALMKNGYVQGKAPCKNCQFMFGNLRGFIDDTHHANDNNDGGSTFLGACAEYCPVNELLTDEPTVPTTDTSLIDVKLKRHKNQCSRLFEDYYDIAGKDFDALDASEVKAVAHEIKWKVHIFGFKPECKM